MSPSARLETAGERSRRLARARYAASCERRRREGLETPGYVRDGSGWTLLPLAEEHSLVPVYPPEWFDDDRGDGRGDGEYVALLAASGLAGAPPRAREVGPLQEAVHCAVGRQLELSGWADLVPGLRRYEWLRLLAEERLGWSRAAEILRTLDVDWGYLALPVNDHARYPPGWT